MFYVIRDKDYQYSNVEIVPYSDEYEYAEGYAKQHGLKPSKIIAIDDKSFEMLEHSKSNGVTYTMSPIYYLDDADVYVIEDEIELLDELGSDVVYGFTSNLRVIYRDLKYFKGKEAKELMKAIAKFKKAIKKKDAGNFSLNLYNMIDPIKVLKMYRYNQEKGEGD